jgi:hypothetical protein
MNKTTEKKASLLRLLRKKSDLGLNKIANE